MGSGYVEPGETKGLAEIPRTKYLCKLKTIVAFSRKLPSSYYRLSGRCQCEVLVSDVWPDLIVFKTKDCEGSVLLKGLALINLLLKDLHIRNEGQSKVTKMEHETLLWLISSPWDDTTVSIKDCWLYRKRDGLSSIACCWDRHPHGPSWLSHFI
jgi:hypothetical protein